MAWLISLRFEKSLSCFLKIVCHFGKLTNSLKGENKPKRRLADAFFIGVGRNFFKEGMQILISLNCHANPFVKIVCHFDPLTNSLKREHITTPV